LLKKQFRVETPVIDGENTAAERETIKKAFQANQHPVLICNNQTAVGIGLEDPTGQVERTTLISPCYWAKLMVQVIGRVHRDSGAFSAQYFVYFADTLEAEIAAIVRDKRENLNALNDALLNGVLHDNSHTPIRNLSRPRSYRKASPPRHAELVGR
jgi:superfamily II DNA or RNA helicase